MRRTAGAMREKNAPDYARAMRLMLQQKKPDDHVIGAAEAHTVREFIAPLCDGRLGLA
jgi:GDP-D-mannose dehydratase